MPLEWDAIERLLGELQTSLLKFDSVATKLIEAAEHLKNGIPPNEELLVGLAQCLESYESICASVSSIDEILLPSDPSLLDIRTKLVDFKDLISQDIKSDALHVLERIQLLCRTDEPDFEPLLHVKNEAQILAIKIQGPEFSSETLDLTCNKHPLTKLLLLVEQGNSLDLQAWDSARESVAGAYGSILASAAARGNLVLSVTLQEVQNLTVTIRNEPSEVSTPTVEPVVGENQILVPLSRELELVHRPKDLGIAREATEIEEDERPLQLAENMYEEETNLLWRWIQERRFGLGYYLIRALRVVAPNIVLPPGEAVRALAMSCYLRRRPLGELARVLEMTLEKLSHEYDRPEQGDENPFINLLLWSALVRPCLLTSSPWATEMLRNIRFKGFPNLYALTEVILDVRTRLHGADPNLFFTGIEGQSGWETEREILRMKVDEWVSRAPEITILYAPATAVWKKWTLPGGILNNLLKPVKKASVEKSAVEKMRMVCQTLSDTYSLRNLIQDTDREMSNRRPGKDIHARALDQFANHVHKAVDFAEEWIQLVEGHPQQPSYTKNQVDHLRQEFNRLCPEINNEIAEYALREPLPSAKASVECLLETLASLRNLFDGDAHADFHEPEEHYIVGADLLLCPMLDLDQQWNPEAGEEAVLAALCCLGREEPSWGEAFQAHLERKDLEGAERIITFLQWRDEPLAGDFLSQFKQALSNNRMELQDRLRQVHKKVEASLVYGFITESEHHSYEASLIGYESNLEGVRRFHQCHGQMDRILDELEEQKNSKTAEARKELEDMALGSSNPQAYQRICNVLERGDILTAREYLGRIRAGEAIEEEPKNTRDVLREFFPERADEIVAFLRSHDIRSILELVKKGENFAGLPMNRLPPGQLDQAHDMLDIWFKIKRLRMGHVAELDMRNLLRLFGFNPQPQMSIRSAGKYVTVEMRTDPINERRICPAPFFGSQAMGHYRILCVWGEPGEEELINKVGGATNRQKATIVFHFGYLSKERRRNLAALCRENKQSFLVVDDALAAFLSAEASRLPSFFRCTLPFTYVEPYVTTSSFVPPEMFFGRRKELESIMGSGGSFVYGGRQLGKTVLLREVERRFHRPDEEQFVYWLDLKDKGLGQNHQPEEIWRTLEPRFKQAGIVPVKFPEPNPNIRGRVAAFVQIIEQWLDAKPERRRILLLLDEADSFLEQDGCHGFPESTRLKALMERTNQRFKVVFAGLHNVLRTTNQANHPLAHLGNPINVGPFLRDGEWFEARSLVKEPLESLGYCFESEDLVTSILAQTNYYPSLIQLYCAQLLQRLNDFHRAGINYQEGPPYIIRERHVEEIFHSRELRENIRERFRLTLQLDPRYHVIAYIIAYLFVSKPDPSSHGLDSLEIRKEVLFWWPQGFKDTNDREFAILLEEMEGLGVLRRLNDGRFTLRNPNLLLLMGTSTEIEGELCQEREMPSVFEPLYFHTPPVRKMDKYRRNPLTFPQEEAIAASKANSNDDSNIFMIFGSEAGGFSDLLPFLRERTDARYLRVLDNAGKAFDSASFVRELEKLQDQNEGGITTTVVIPASISWATTWITAADDQIKKSKASERLIRCLFLADPRLIWELLNSSQLPDEKCRITLGPWHDVFMRQWLVDMELPNEHGVRQKIKEVTGNWPGLLYEFCRGLGRSGRWEQYVTEFVNMMEGNGQIQQMFGLDIPECRDTIANLLALDKTGCFKESDLPTIAEMCGLLTDRLIQICRFGQLLGFVTREKDELQFDPVLCKLFGD